MHPGILHVPLGTILKYRFLNGPLSFPTETNSQRITNPYRISKGLPAAIPSTVGATSYLCIFTIGYASSSFEYFPSSTHLRAWEMMPIATSSGIPLQVAP